MGLSIRAGDDLKTPGPPGTAFGPTSRRNVCTTRTFFLKGVQWPAAAWRAVTINVALFGAGAKTGMPVERER